MKEKETIYYLKTKLNKFVFNFIIIYNNNMKLIKINDIKELFVQLLKI
jgi:hypothetical protein